MKTILRLVFILSVVVLFSSCMKVVDVPQQQTTISPLTGTWVVSNADENNGYGWQPFSPAFGNGVFDFYDRGLVQYNDANTSLSGNWHITTNTGGYYDEYGNFYSDIHQSLEMHLSDSYSGNALDLYFDYIHFVNSNHFIGTYLKDGYTERYSFSRY